MQRILSLLVLFLSAQGATAQFTLQTSNTIADLRGIHSLGNGVAWASGTNGTVLRTEDGGYVWQSCSIPPGAGQLDFRGIQAFDANTAIVMSSGKGDLSRLYKTTDGCHTWTLIFTNPDADGFWDALYFHSGQGGWLLGDPVRGAFTLFSTDDRGKTWVRKHNKGLTADPAAQGAFAASNSSLIAPTLDVVFGSGGLGGAFVYRRTQIQICLDDCATGDLDLQGRKDKWDRQPVPLGAHSETSGVFSIETKNGSNTTLPSNFEIVAVGGDYSRPDESSGSAVWSADGGEHWATAQTPPHGYRSSVAYDAPSKSWITVGPNGTDISTDDGHSWLPLHPNLKHHDAPDADQNWNALSLPFVVGPKGRIGRLNPNSLPH